MADHSGLPPLAISLGDPAGIGPELIAAAWARREAEKLPAFCVVGGARLLAEAASQRGLAVDIQVIADPGEALAAFTVALPVLPLADCDYTPGEPSEQGAALALHSLAEAMRFALVGAASALVTAPVAKSQLVKVGFEYPGQTEFLAEASGLDTEAAVMMLAGPSVRAVPLTIHCAIAEVPARLSIELIVKKATITASALQRDFGIANPRIAVSGLNPHAGEGGRFGREELDIIAPAIELLVSQGIDATGPHPADALFAPRQRATFDAAICMYHDQALIPVKALDFDQGVNVTLGLPFVRTSPDHGTAFDIAGKGIADPGAMIAAIRMAGGMAARRAAI
ncbi:4-hydroxythreonine-4-phosphate dehydrogenase PdxA [Parerythrobacter lacustris]|uniref:4-hydroxythreonine-4-phosphate dehydrogenase n=1 Tax=Parerythrobacter lacustris TaxID=2969984 RepID=A0ABT1XNM4_9SPHN|nr:4-hydroxythreonine-4-phosphate dehydrogenase PdxA [Parerythrobacter lacustris]MCR2833258.1 4-hydroxythreonine-4-phosphate dehydrogenase PdxA [Parerythrobacter lacustris]